MSTANGTKDADIKKQIEYYLGDKNMSMDDFFRGKISESKAGYIDLKLMLNCNKIKNMGITVEQIVEACQDSKEIEISKDKKMVRRMKNKELPPKVAGMKKRDLKAQGKQEGKTEGTNGGKEDYNEDAVETV